MQEQESYGSLVHALINESVTYRMGTSDADQLSTKFLIVIPSLVPDTNACICMRRRCAN